MVFAPLLIPGLAFLTALVLLGWSQGSALNTKAQTEAQQSWWQFIVGSLDIRRQIRAWVQTTRAAMSRWALSHMRPVTRWFVALNALVLHGINAQVAAVEAIANAFARTDARLKTKASTGQVAAAGKQAGKANKKAAAAAGAAAATATALTHYKTANNARVHHNTTAITHVNEVDLPRIRTGNRARDKTIAKHGGAIADLEQGAAKTWDWLRTHSRSATTGAFAAAVAVALTRLGYGFLRCRSWKNVSKRLTCGMGSLLNDLLFAAEFFALTIAGLCNIAGAATLLAETMRPFLLTFVDVEDALIGCHGATKPAPLTLPTSDLPATNLGLPLASK